MYEKKKQENKDRVKYSKSLKLHYSDRNINSSNCRN